ncbi:XrtB/PEP-CTERM-associated polysaccharide biosynthesis outer membrane protein EpsL [Aromatoleum evansii]|uniref:XrtB/PEP-CTERM-associated polysaccharide biosynthesis outer membrane protein EpsL n=1 Tax=Aromatoleum evansii TaxID=59406 RepID=A0ABZ1AEI3_AROEV|nr:XrtB/PEP-CTERM-associated polysaccharide biosynthesis outer membrane protein EpsL [Aromatoleum evansii]NMG29266.1 outer membrane beta-barrel protein [Aromatoleum evansii]WRL44268.1 XrtB/PEP-CTERM-associated polysaccharide biosynthesis outer membrane protein EpsL [Aromatoleum evansii]
MFSFLVIAGTGTLPVAASENDPLTISVSQDLVWEDNLFRVADGARPEIEGSRRPRDDRLSVTTLAAQLGRTYSRQRLTADFALTRSDYLEFDHLDFTAHNFGAAWQWILGNQWSGTISARQDERLRSFSDRIGTVRSINTFRQYRADARYLMHPQWSFGAGWARMDSRFDDRESAGSEYIEDAVEALVQYRSLAGSTLALVGRDAEGRYPERNETLTTVTGYTQRDLLLRADWGVTGHSRVSGQVGYTARQYPHAGDKDFNGLTGRVTFDWNPTGKLALGMTARREMGAREDVADNFVITRAVSVDPVWQIGNKLRLRGRLEWLKRDYGGDPFGIVAPDRDDRTQARALALEWSPARNLSLQLGARNERRSSSDAYPGYRAASLFMSAKLAF